MTGFPNSQSNAAAAIPVWITGDNSGVSLTDTGSNNEPIPSWVGDSYGAVTINATSGTTPQVLFTGSPGYFITRLFVQISPGATVSGGGTITLTFTDTGSGQVIGQLTAYLPATFVAPTVPTIGPAAVPGPGFFFRSKTATSTLTVSTNTTLTGTGTIRVAANGGTTSIIS